MKRLWTALVCLLFLLPMQTAAAENIVRIMWEPIEGAVLYEVILTADKDGGKDDAVWQDTCSANGIEIDADIGGARYCRVRGIDYEHQAVSEWRTAERLTKAKRAGGVPEILFAGGEHPLLYPVYTWIPVWGAVGYEIEMNDTESTSAYLSAAGARKIKVAGGAAFDYYDEEPALRAGVHCWRVRALYPDGVRSAWSRSGTFEVTHGDAVYAAIGDSITHGGGSVTHTPNEPAYDWTTYTGRKVKNLGLSGDVTAHIADRIAREAADCGAKIVFIMGGINDLRAGETAETVIANLARAVREAKSVGLRPILLTVPPVNPPLMTERMGYPLAPNWQTEQRRVNEWILAQMDSIDAAHAVTDERGYLSADLTTDGLHPDSEGKRRIGEAVRIWLDEHDLP